MGLTWDANTLLRRLAGAPLPPSVNPLFISFYKGEICWPCPKCGVAGPFHYFPEVLTSHKYDKSIPIGKTVRVPGRWTCKWCGYYWSKQFGERQCVPDHERGVWMFREDASNPNEPTPQEVAKKCGLVMVGLDENRNPILDHSNMKPDLRYKCTAHHIAT